MDVSSIATAFVGAAAARVQMAAAAKLMKMNADQERSIATLLEAASKNASSLANVAQGLGGNLDISV
jgi:hypothetical protein